MNYLDGDFPVPNMDRPSSLARVRTPVQVVHPQDEHLAELERRNAKRAKVIEKIRKGRKS